MSKSPAGNLFFILLRTLNLFLSHQTQYIYIYYFVKYGFSTISTIPNYF